MAKSGNFNLDFPGANIICDTSQKREAILDFVKGKSNNIDVSLSASDMDRDILNAIYNTTYIHEGRHLHDHLVCPQLLHNYTLKLTALFYSVLGIDAWKHTNSKYKYIPLPFTTWIELPKEKQLKLIAEKGISIEDVPIYSLNDATHLLAGDLECEDNFAKALLLGALHYSKYRYNAYQNSPDGYSTELSIRTFTESIAYVQQVTELAIRYKNYGELLNQRILQASFNNFIEVGRKKRDQDALITSKDYIGYSIYTSAFTMAWRYACQNNISSTYIYPFISYVLFWALSGNVIEGNKESNYPRNRIECLFNLDIMGVDLNLRDEGVIRELFNDPLKTFYKWDLLIENTFGNTNIKIQSQDSLFTLNGNATPINYEEFYGKLLSSFIPMVRHLVTNGYDAPANYIYNVAGASYYMTSLFQKNSCLYLYPEAYSRHLSKFINVPFRIDFVNVEPISLEECGRLREGVTIVDNSIWGNSLTELPNNDHPMLNWEYYFKSKQYIDFSNALLGDSDVNMPSRIVKENLPGIKTWFFLD